VSSGVDPPAPAPAPAAGEPPALASVLVTGAAGFIGSHLAEACLERGWRVLAVDCFADYYDAALKQRNAEALRSHPRCTFLEADLMELDPAELFAGVDVAFHLAAQAGVRASWGSSFDVYLRQNVAVTQRLLEAARGSRLQRFVYASSSSVYGDAEAFPTREDAAPKPVSPYGVTKVACEQLARLYHRNYGVPCVGIRYFTVFGPRQRPDMAFNRLIAATLAGEEFTVFGDGGQTRDFTFVADAVDGTLAAGLRGTPGSLYNLGGGARRSMNDVFATVEALLDRAPNLRFTETQRCDARDTAADITLAAVELGFAPRRSFEDGLRAQVTWQTLAAV
jgi:nucleoside-diphosphate-sugar epimerase